MIEELKIQKGETQEMKKKFNEKWNDYLAPKNGKERQNAIHGTGDSPRNSVRILLLTRIQTQQLPQQKSAKVLKQ